MPDTILITGGTGKIGRQLVEYFLQKGFVVVFSSRSQEHIDEFIHGRKGLHGIQLDFEDSDAVKKLKGTLQKRGLQINFLVNNVRSLETLNVLDDGSIPDKNWHREYQIDVVTPYKLSLALSKTGALKKIVNISSIYGVSAYNPHLYEGDFSPALQYACAKAALIQLTRCLAVIFAPRKIAVNCISYGGVEGRVDADFMRRYAQLCPAERMMKEQETVGAVGFLIGKESEYITGQNIIVDGGWTIW